MCSFISINKNLFNQLDDFIDSLDWQKDNLLQVLHHAQSIFGYLPQEVQIYISNKLDTPTEKIHNLVNFYSYFITELKGEFKINVCLGSLCLKKGADVIVSEFEKELGVKPGQSTEDLKFSLDLSRCVGSCGLAPVVVINEKVYSRVTAQDVKNILADFS